jgi:two-component system nitrogen regulation response regulator GlnG
MPKLLVIDDEEPILHAFARVFRAPDTELATACTAGEGLRQVRDGRPDVVVLDVHLPDQSGLEAFRQIQKIDARIPVVFITGHGTTETAIEAIKLGAYEYLLKPLELAQLRDVVGRAFHISRLMKVPAVVPGGREAVEPAAESDVLVGNCPAMQEVYKSIGRVAPQDVTVLILGESGTGKELVARAIYQHGRRAGGPFLAINCAAIPENLLESELFGHEKGAFTGADRKRIGKFEQCSGGTLFLDEIGDMTPLTQSKVLRVLQDRKFERVGGNETIKTDVRVIAATNRDLEAATAAGRFRADLYYRLSVFTIRLPPLRERTEDIPLLTAHFIRKFGAELNRPVRSAAPEAVEILKHYPWPGNVRELQSVIKQALIKAKGPVLIPEFLPDGVRSAPQVPVPVGGDGSPAAATAPAAPVPAAPLPSSTAVSAPPAAPAPPAHPPACVPVDPFAQLARFVDERLAAGSQDLLAEWRNLTEAHLLRQLLHHTGGNISQTAKILGINRSTLRGRIEALGLKSLTSSGEDSTG